MIVRRLVCGLSAVVMGLPLAACGDNESVALSREEFVAQATAICRAADEFITDAESDWLDDQNPTIDEAKAFYAAVTDQTVEALTKISDLGYPEADQATLSVHVDKARELLVSAKTELADFQSLEELEAAADFNSGSRFAELFKEADAEITAFSDYGPKICFDPGTPAE
jgi:hypothetical protein